MKIETLLLGELAANCHIIDCGGGLCAAVDIGNSPEKLLRYLDQSGLQLKAILLTHGHYDHIGGVEAVRQATGADVYIHEADAPMLESAQKNLAYQITPAPYQPVTAYNTVQDGDTITVSELQFSVMHTPGHTAGGVCYRAEDVLFTGDTLFAGSIGRTDLGGNPAQMRTSLRKLYDLSGDAAVYPGHGGSSSLAAERRSNPYMRSL